MDQEKKSESNNINNNNTPNPVCETIFQNLPTDLKERKQYIYQVKRALKDEKRKLKEIKCEKYGNKHCKRDKHEKHEKHDKHESFHGHRSHHGHPESPFVGCNPGHQFGGHHGHPGHQLGGHHGHPGHQFGGHYGHPGHHFGGHHGHPGHHFGGHHGHHGHHFGGHHGHPGHHFGGHHGHEMMNGWSIQSKINHLNRKKQVLIAKTQLIESKIAALTELNQTPISVPTNQPCQDQTPVTPQQPIDSVIGSFSQM
ncbi:hypothetical protein RB653_002017 [Dictyostelium firmibasis]|uniref:Uncharacterized protein n=1 Tax=Dictyostelium firmibasis TaxID=79012 RepID=A0AAN7TPY0_9MYCE